MQEYGRVIKKLSLMCRHDFVSELFKKFSIFLKMLLLFLVSIMLLGCDDGSQTYVQDKQILTAKIPCMRLTVSPPNKKIESTLYTLYAFKKECDYNFVVSYKTAITCNSNQNADKKIYGLPQSYLRMEIKKEGRLEYTYYKDLRANVSMKDVQKGFRSIKENLHL
jgi:hypothetical protein